MWNVRGHGHMYNVWNGVDQLAYLAYEGREGDGQVEERDGNMGQLEG